MQKSVNTLQYLSPNRKQSIKDEPEHRFAIDFIKTDILRISTDEISLNWLFSIRFRVRELTNKVDYYQRENCSTTIYKDYSNDFVAQYAFTPIFEVAVSNNAIVTIVVTTPCKG